MKLISKLSLLAAATTLVSGTAHGDSPQLQHWLSTQRQNAERSRTADTIGVYAHKHAVGERVTAPRRGTTDASGRPVHIHTARGEVVYAPRQR